MSPHDRIASGVLHATEEVRAADGERLFLQRWQPAEGEPVAVLVLSHGFGEHTGSYLPFVNSFVARGAVVYGHDHRGFGRSGGLRGFVQRYEHYVEDLRALVERARAENPGRPLVLVGHSMGGTIAVHFTLRYPQLIELAIYSAPALIVALPVPRWKRTLARVMSRLYPAYPNTSRPDPTILSRDLEIQRATAADPLRHSRMTARLYQELFVRAPREILSGVGELSVPFLVIHGTADRLIAPQSSQLLYDAAPATLRSIHLYEGLRHELFREIERETVFADVAGWLVDHGIPLHPLQAEAQPLSADGAVIDQAPSTRAVQG